MRLECVALLVLLFAAFAAAQSNTSSPVDFCANIPECFECLSTMGCGWCAPTLSCHTGNYSAPTDGTVCTQEWFGAGHTMGGTRCPEIQCTQYTNCVSCLKQASCGWCEPTDGGPASCQALGQECPGGEPVDHSCPCNNYNTCEDCVNDGDCVFCISSRTCETIDPNQGNCKNNDPNDQLIGNCPCSAWSDCDTCTDAEGCAWCDGKVLSRLPRSCIVLMAVYCSSHWGDVIFLLLTI